MARDRSPRQRFYDTATTWAADRGADNAKLIDAAVTALLAGLDSPTLREIAASQPGDDTDDLQTLLDATASELLLPRLGSLALTDVIADDGTIGPRVAVENLQLKVVHADTFDDFEVQVFIDGVEMTSRAAGAGMGPFTLFVPENRLVATTEPHVAPIARCQCGEYGCGVTDVRIVRHDGVVHWDWLAEVPMPHGVTFDAAEYDAEISRAASDRSWERPEDFVRREIVVRSDAHALWQVGLALRSAWRERDQPDRIRLSLDTIDRNYQVFFLLDFDERRPTSTVDEALRVLARPPAVWAAEFHAIRPDVTARPAMAGASWTRFEFPRRAAR
ncbi:hypothetical protein GCM10009809_38190 [Isoptericola hypogeus]|uniref:Uncharacterized protein n=1 Tax=Isoptericola hypogeus TaxID=300179 RepID=A0ABN2JWE4_9MICO